MTSNPMTTMNTMKSRIISGAAVTLLLAGMAVVPAFAQTGTSTTARQGHGLSQADRMKALGARGDKEVDVRVDSLNKLIARIQELKNVSDAQKTSIIANIQNLVTTLTNLKAQIDSDSASTTLKDDVQAV